MIYTSQIELTGFFIELKILLEFGKLSFNNNLPFKSK